MSNLSDAAIKRLLIATSDVTIGNEIASAINNSKALAAGLQGLNVVSIITATGTSQTTDFGSLAVGDQILHFPAVAGGVNFNTCAVAYGSGSVTYTASSGAQTCTINGTQVSFADAGTDADNAAALVDEITGNVTLAALVTAEVDGVDDTKVNIVAIASGVAGNYTLAVTGTGAARSAATLTGGSKAGQLPVAAVSGDKYIVLRAVVPITASAAKF